jgi:cell division protein FtsQ
MSTAWHDTKLLNSVANALFTAAMVSLMGASVWWVSQRPMFTIRHVQVDSEPTHPLRYVHEPVLRSVVSDRIGGNFFSIDLHSVREAFESVPWVRRATVRRVWPNSLHVTLEEHRAFAIWNSDGLLNTQGETFAANLDEAEEERALPRLSGPTGTERLVMERYLEMVEALKPLKLAPNQLDLSPRRAWTAKLSDGSMLLLGRDQGVSIPERLALWIEVYPKVTERIGQRAQTIDLRYPNGFALRPVSVSAELGREVHAAAGSAKP